MPKLYYFGFSARAEAARLLFDIGGIPFEDFRFSGEEWGAKYKAMSPTGQCPFLELEDGTVLAQSYAISTYVAAKGGLLPKDELKLAQNYELMMMIEELFIPIRPTFGITDEAERIATRKALVAPGGEVYKKMEIMEKLMARTSSKFYLGDDIGMADVTYFTLTDFLASGHLDGFDTPLTTDFPRGKAICEAVKAHPKVAAHYAKK